MDAQGKRQVKHPTPRCVKPHRQVHDMSEPHSKRRHSPSEKRMKKQDPLTMILVTLLPPLT